MRTSIVLVLSSAALLALAPSCNKKKAPDTTAGSAGSAVAETGSAGSAMMGSAGSATAPTPPPAPTGPTDPQIAAIVVAANQVDIDAGNLAIKKTKNPE